MENSDWEIVHELLKMFDCGKIREWHCATRGKLNHHNKTPVFQTVFSMLHKELLQIGSSKKLTTVEEEGKKAEWQGRKFPLESDVTADKRGTAYVYYKLHYIHNHKQENTLQES